MPSGKKVFIIGPGLIGWNVVELLVADSYEVSALVRSQGHAASIQKSGASTVLGTIDDHDLIVEHARKSDIVIHTATADHLPSVQAVLDGVSQRVKNGQDTVFIHTSGTGVINDGFKGRQIYYDDNPDPINALSDDQPHRTIDLAIVRAQKELGTAAKMAIMTPPLIYGLNPHHKRLSIQIPTLTRFALKYGYSGHLDDGLALESMIHVMDLARAYIVLLHWMETCDPNELLPNPYFFCENGKEFTWREVAEEIGKGLHAAGKIESPEPKTIPKELRQEPIGNYPVSVSGYNSRSRAVRLRKMGWEPAEKDIWESYHEDELPLILAQEG